MESGKLNKSVQIQVLAETRGSSGEITRAWTTVATRQMSVAPILGREYMNAQQVQSDVTHRVRMRYYDGLTSEHRLLFDGRVLHILSILNPFERNEQLEVMCKEQV